MEYKVNVEYLFTVKDDNGIDVKCDTLAVIDREEDTPLIVYTDYTKNSKGEYNTYISELRVVDGEASLEEVDEEELNLPIIGEAITAALAELQKIMKEKEEA